MLSHIKDIIKKSSKEGYAVGAFNVHGLESILGVANAAMKVKSPVIIQISEGAIKYIGLKPAIHLVSTVAKNVATKVPVALHLDHGRNLDSVMGCINAGFSSVHIDASHLPLDENIALTKQVVDIAHRKKVWVQGEVGSMVGGHGAIGDKIEIPLADPQEVVEFVKKTGIDTVAAAIGTAHGVYKNQDIKINLLKEIKEKTNIPFVLHGGSGNSDAKIKKAIDNGVNIINIGTNVKVAFCDAVKKSCRENPEENDPRNLLRPSIVAIEKVVINRMKMFGSAERVLISDIKT